MLQTQTGHIGVLRCSTTISAHVQSSCKNRRPVVAQKLVLNTLAVFAFAAVAVQAQPAMGPPSEQRFQMMDRMMEDAQKSCGPERHKKMQAMHAEHAAHDARNAASRTGADGGPNPTQMQERMDMMQRMIE